MYLVPRHDGRNHRRLNRRYEGFDRNVTVAE